MSLNFQERIDLSYETFNFIRSKIENIYKKVKREKNKIKLKGLCEETKMWAAKCDLEGRILDQLKEEAGL